VAKAPKIAKSSFQFSHIEKLLPIFNGKARICMNILENEAGGPEFDISDAWSRLSLDNILCTSTGINLNIQIEKHNQYLKDVVM